MMKILNISSHPLFPLSDGGRAHIYSCISRLLENNDITLLCCKNEEKFDIKRLRIDDCFPLSKTKFINLKVLLKIFKESRKADKIIIDYPWFGLHLILLSPFIRKRYELREHNIEFLRLKSYHKWFWLPLYFYEMMVYKCADTIRFISHEDKKLAVKYFKVSEKKSIIETYKVDKSRFYPSDKHKVRIRKSLNLEENEKFIIFFGRLNYEPNIEAVYIIKNEIVPRLNRKNNFKYKMIIIGKNPPHIKDDNIIFTGFINNIEEYVQSCDMMINPLLCGGGIKTKVIETLACNKKVVSTQKGAEGIPKNKNLIIIKNSNWKMFVDNML
jgi:glycosyltransferase involved in cell wall biosynthesis